MTHADAFLQAILDAPDDDAPRLIFADWLAEHGQEERAEFIRCQCLVSRWANTPSNQPGGRMEDGAAAGAALARAEELLFRTRPGEWSHFPEAFAVALDTLWDFHRGFPEIIRCPSAAWLEHSDALTRAAPIREVTLTTWLDWYIADYAAKRVALHNGIHPNVGGVIYECKTAKVPGRYGPNFDPQLISEMLAAEWSRIKFLLPAS